MRRIAVVGTTGSGKTTLARQLALRLGSPFVEEDALAWEPNWTETPHDVLRQRIADALRGETWVVDGNMFALGHPNLQVADTVVWLDLPLSMILWRLVWRTLRRIAMREELWSGNRERWRIAFFSRDSLLWLCASDVPGEAPWVCGAVRTDRIRPSDCRPPTLAASGPSLAVHGQALACALAVRLAPMLGDEPERRRV